MTTVDLSIVIPVFNGAGTIENVVAQIQTVFSGRSFEVVLVNDGSEDDSEQACLRIVERHPSTVSFVQLGRNFGEHNAVLAGLGCARGAHVGIMDDDGQHPPEELFRLWQEIRETGVDVVYGRYLEKQHNWFRNLGSWFNDRVATCLIGKPRDLYFSSFKVMARPLVNEVLKYRGPFAYLDGLIFRATNSIRQVDVVHQRRERGRSGYTWRKLVRLWLNMCLGFSMIPLRVTFIFGAVVAGLGALALGGVFIDKVWLHPQVALGASAVLACIVFCTGIQLVALSIVGEYVGRIFLQQSGMPQYVVRYVKHGDVVCE